MGTFHEYKKRFTLIELLAVIAVGILLTALAVPAFRSMTQANRVAECAGNLKGFLERARVRAANERCCVAVILPNGEVSNALKQYRLGGCRLAYVEKNVSGEYIFGRWLDEEWTKAPAGTLLSQTGSSAFASDGGDITGCTLKITDELVGAAACLSQVSAIRSDDGSTALNAGQCKTVQIRHFVFSNRLHLIPSDRAHLVTVGFARATLELGSLFELHGHGRSLDNEVKALVGVVRDHYGQHLASLVLHELHTLELAQPLHTYTNLYSLVASKLGHALLAKSR